VVSSSSGCLHPPRVVTRALTLAWLQSRLEELLESHRPDVVVVETSFSAKFPRSALALAEVRGALLATLGHWGGAVVELEPARVKAAVVGHGRAEKQQVAYVVQRHLALSETPGPDAADALALALACLLLGTHNSREPAPPAPVNTP
jgi:crossover junction endodeoxyribonuclease RuvC